MNSNVAADVNQVFTAPRSDWDRGLAITGLVNDVVEPMAFLKNLAHSLNISFNDYQIVNNYVNPVVKKT